MPIELPDLEPRVQKAVAFYWTKLIEQGGDSDERRQAVVGGKVSSVRTPAADILSAE